MRSLLSRALILLGLTAIAFAQADPIQAALDKKDFATAFKLLKPLSDQGDAEAQEVLAGLVQFWQGVGPAGGRPRGAPPCGLLPEIPG